MAKYDLNSMRKKLKDRNGGFKDPNQFIPPQVKDGEKKIWRFYVLPPLQEGEGTSDGVASKGMDLFYVPNGSHWVSKKPHACPRIHDETECPMCSYAFELMSETDDKDKRRAIAKNYLPQQRYAVNIYFPNIEANPEEVRGKVMWFNAPKQVYDIWDSCIMRDTPGDDADPQAYGVFFDEEAAYLFQLEAQKHGDYNEYKSSKFLSNVGKQPLAKAKKGDQVVPDAKRISDILAQRFDLFTKFDDRDVNKIHGLVDNIKNKEPGGDGDGFDEDDNVRTPPANSRKPQQTARKPVTEEVDLNAGLAGEGAIADKKPAKPAATNKPAAAKPAPAKQEKPAPPPVEEPVEEVAEAAPATETTASDGVDDAELQSLLSEIEKPSDD